MNNFDIYTWLCVLYHHHNMEYFYFPKMFLMFLYHIPSLPATLSSGKLLRSFFNCSFSFPKISNKFNYKVCSFFCLAPFMLPNSSQLEVNFTCKGTFGNIWKHFWLLLLPPGTTPGRGKRLDSIANTWSSISRKIDFIQSQIWRQIEEESFMFQISKFGKLKGQQNFYKKGQSEAKSI